jgi:hypothetical protein
MFTPGEKVYYKGLSGTVNFVCSKYITILVKKGEHKSLDVNVLVHPENYDNVVDFNSK